MTMDQSQQQNRTWSTGCGPRQPSFQGLLMGRQIHSGLEQGQGGGVLVRGSAPADEGPMGGSVERRPVHQHSSPSLQHYSTQKYHLPSLEEVGLIGPV